MARDWRATARILREEPCLGSTPATAMALSELHSPSVGRMASVQASNRSSARAGPWRTAPSQTLLPPRPPTPACEGLPTAWSGCCGSRNTLAHCPVSSLGEKGEEALAGVLGTALPFPAHRKFVSSPIPPPWLVWKRQDKPHIPSACPSHLSPAVPACGRCQGKASAANALPGRHGGCAQPHTLVAHTHPSWDTQQRPSTWTHRCFPNSLHGLAPVHTCVNTHPLLVLHTGTKQPHHTHQPPLHTPLPPRHCVCPAPPPPCAASLPPAQPCTTQAGTPCHLPVTLLASASPSLHLTPGLWAAAPN